MKWWEENGELLFYSVLLVGGVISLAGLTYLSWTPWRTVETLNLWLENLTLTWGAVTAVGLATKEVPVVFAEAYLKRKEEKGRREGRVEGRAEGRTEGRTEGRAEGKIEGKIEGKAEGKAAEWERTKNAMQRLAAKSPDGKVSPDELERELNGSDESA